MNAQLQITFRNVNPSKEVEECIHAAAAKLDTFYNQVMGCRVAVESPHHHRTRNQQYNVRIRLALPGGEIVVKREPSLNARSRQLHEQKIRKSSELKTTHKDLRLAINDAFRVAGRRLQDYARRQRGDTKSRTPLPEGRISRLLREKGYGYLTSNDGREIYFHKNSVLNGDFSALKVGRAVRFAEEAGEKGPQASSVHLVSGRRIRQMAKGAAV